MSKNFNQLTANTRHQNEICPQYKPIIKKIKKIYDSIHLSDKVGLQNLDRSK